MAIDIKKSHVGLLHKDLGKSKDSPLSAADLAKAKHSASAATRKRANFAINAKKWAHKGRKKPGEKSAGHAGKLYGSAS